MDQRELTFETIAFGGEALARDNGQVVFVPYALPGERAWVELGERKKDYARGEIVRLIEGSGDRVQPPCPYFGHCGGCQWQHAGYAAQLGFKRSVVVEQLGRIGHFAAPRELVRPPIGMHTPWNYRNHARFSLGKKYGELCFTMPHSRRMLRVDHCWILHPAINAALAKLQRAVPGLPAHQVTIRVGANTGQLLVSPAVPQVPELSSGQDYMEEELLGQRFRIAAPAFFQVNTVREARPLPLAIRKAALPLPADGVSIAELLALLVLDRLDLSGGEFVVDAYSGVGTFAVLMAPLVGKVFGIEDSAAAVKNARYNARDLTNVEFVAGKTEAVLPSLARRPDAVVLDPARMGCHPALLQELIARKPRRLIYVSCDPATLARDLRLLVDGGFHLHEVQPLDMFPQTYHVECVATLEA